jgi:ABC-type glycerol-3-phosphate transport system substrate-binding protein
MLLRRTLLASAMAGAAAGPAAAACSFRPTTTIRSLSAAFESWKVVTAAMAECGNVQSELDQEFRRKQPDAFAANPALYHIGGVSNGTIVPLLNAGTIRPLDDYVARFGQQLQPNQMIRIQGRVMAIAMQVNAQHFMYREDIFQELGLSAPATWDDALAAAEKIKASGKVQFPLAATMRTGFDLSQEFVNLFLGFGGRFTNPDNTPAIRGDAGTRTLEMMRRIAAYLDPVYLTSDSTFVQRALQQGRSAMANLWATRAAALDDPRESQVAGKMVMAAAPAAVAGGPSATTLWWDGIVIARNVPDAEAEAAFRVAMEGIDEEMVRANNNVAVWLIRGYQPNRLSQGVVASAQGRAPSYPSTPVMGLMSSVIGERASDFMAGRRGAAETLGDIESTYVSRAREQGLIR